MMTVLLLMFSKEVNSKCHLALKIAALTSTLTILMELTPNTTPNFSMCLVNFLKENKKHIGTSREAEAFELSLARNGFTIYFR